MALPASIHRYPLMFGVAIRAMRRHWRTRKRSKACFAQEYPRSVFLSRDGAAQHDLPEICLHPRIELAQLPLLPIYMPPLSDRFVRNFRLERCRPSLGADYSGSTRAQALADARPNRFAFSGKRIEQRYDPAPIVCRTGGASALAKAPLRSRGVPAQPQWDRTAPARGKPFTRRCPCAGSAGRIPRWAIAGG